VEPAFFRDRSVTFDVTHDGDAHEYQITFTPRHAVTAVRLDPGQRAGEVRLSALKLTGTGGKTLYQWKFDGESTEAARCDMRPKLEVRVI
jgi:hypothetical protein